jgi:putative DNA methylase
MPTRKKLIEVALPLEAINVASAREKSIRHGHPSTLHLWWARRPLAAARAVIFTSLVDDPDSPDALPAFVEACKQLPKGANAAVEDTPRMRLFDFIERLVTWEATTDEAILTTARELIMIATEGSPPPLLDPFAGGGSIPLEAQRLGLEAHASDLNPVAVMINKAQIEIPPRFANMPPVNPRDRAKMGSGEGWKGAAGLAADVRYYGEWMREKAWERIGHLYPTHNGETVIAWIWARTVKSPNPAVNAPVPLVRSFILSKKKGRERWAKPIIEGNTVHFEVVEGAPPKEYEIGTMSGRTGGRCIISGEPIPKDYIKAEAQAGRMSAMLMAIVTEGKGGRNYYSPTPQHAAIVEQAKPEWRPVGELADEPRAIWVKLYGLTDFADLFTPRQLVALTTFSDLVAEAREHAYHEAIAAGLPDNRVPLRDGGRGALAYAEALDLYLAFGVSRFSNYCCSLSSWHNSADFVRAVFARQAIPMAWDYVDVNPFSSSTGNFYDNFEWVAEATESIKFLEGISHSFTRVNQADAASKAIEKVRVLSTDPPYYDNIGYADLSDFFYIWLRPMLRQVYPEIFGTMLVPKEPELIASPYRHGGKAAANVHFETGLHQTFVNVRRFISLDYPLTVYYAFKQQDAEAVDDEDDENRDTQIVSSGWETMLTSLIDSGFSIGGTWPMRTELGNRMIGSGTNALASSIVLVCRPRPEDAPTSSRRAFVDALRRELPAALKEMQSGNIAPVDLAQASIGPGMAIYSRYSKVLEADGSPMSVRAALGLINQELDAYLAEQDGDIDADTRFAVAWFEQFAFTEGEFGMADTLARAKNTSVAGVSESGLVTAGRGKVKLLHWKDYLVDPPYDPAADKRPTVWEATHHLIQELNIHGETGSALLMTKLPPDTAAEARALAYRLYSICERKGWADHARDYNALVISWAGIGEEAARLKQAREAGDATVQGRLFE